MTDEEDPLSMARELGRNAAKFFARGVDADRGLDSDDPMARYAVLRDAVAAMGWFDLPVERHFGGPGAPLLTTEIFYAAGRTLVSGPLVDDVVVGPVIGTLVPAARQLLDSRAPVVWVDGLDHMRGSNEGGARVRGDTLIAAIEAAPHVSSSRSLLVTAFEGSVECLLLLPADRNGVQIRSLESLDRCAQMSQLRIECRVGPEDVLATGIEAVVVMDAVRSLARLAVSAELCGMASQLLDMSVEHALGRSQFGRSIGSFQAVKHMLAEMACDVIGLTNLVHDTTSRFLDAAESTFVLCAALKSHASRVALHTASLALQVHGGIGFTHEHRLHRYYKHILGLEHRFGSPAELDRLIGAMRIEAGRPA